MIEKKEKLNNKNPAVWAARAIDQLYKNDSQFKLRSREGRIAEVANVIRDLVEGEQAEVKRAVDKSGKKLYPIVF